MDRPKLGVILAVLVFLLIVGGLTFISLYQKISVENDGNTNGNQTIIEEGRHEIHNVAIGRYAFTPRRITIKQGDSVNWVNTEGKGYHVLVSYGGQEINTGKIYSGENYTHTFEKKGEFKYVSTVNDMEGVVIVE